MLLIGETFNERKKRILRDIKRSLGSMQLYQKCTVTFPNLRKEFYETLALERELYDSYVQELIELKKWRNKTGIGEDEQYELHSKTSQ